MKRSTLLFVFINLVLLLIPIFLMLGLRMKITSGDITDLKAKYEAGLKVEHNTGPIETIILNSKYNGLSLRLEMDTINKISLDTATAKYTHYQFNNGVLTIDYNFEKDSLENSPIFDVNSDGEREENANVHRWITIHTTSSPKKYDIKGSTAEILISKSNLIRNDLELISTDGYISFSNLNEEFIDFSDPDGWKRRDSIPYKMKINMKDASLSLSFRYVKELDLELRNSKVLNFVEEFGHMDLVIDRISPLKLEVATWEKIKLKYTD